MILQDIYSKQINPLWVSSQSNNQRIHKSFQKIDGTKRSRRKDIFRQCKNFYYIMSKLYTSEAINHIFNINSIKWRFNLISTWCRAADLKLNLHCIFLMLKMWLSASEVYNFFTHLHDAINVEFALENSWKSFIILDRVSRSIFWQWKCLLKSTHNPKCAHHLQKLITTN